MKQRIRHSATINTWELDRDDSLQRDLKSVIAELWQPEGPPSGAPYPYRKEKETHELKLLSLDSPCTSLILNNHVMINWHLWNKVSTDQYHVTILRAQVYNSSRPHVFTKLTADQMLVFDWIAGSSKDNLLKTGQYCLEAGNASPGLKFIQVITFSSIQMFFFAIMNHQIN